MPIKYNKQTKKFVLTTKNTMYVMQVVHDRFLGHIYYGRKKRGLDPEFEYRSGSFCPTYDDTRNFAPDLVKTEYSFFGDGDYRSTSLKMRGENGNDCTHFDYKSHRIFKGRAHIDRLPYSEVKDGEETLEITMYDSLTDCELKLYYTVMEDCDVIARHVKIENRGTSPVDIEKCMSLQVELEGQDFDKIFLPGDYAHEREYHRFRLPFGYQNHRSRRGSSSHHFNPFLALCRLNTTEERGECYGFNFVYSGNFLTETEMFHDWGCRVQLGIGDDMFRWHLCPGEIFESPEAVMTYTDKGIGQMSRNFHKFTRERILPPEIWEKRPVVINTWEALYMSIDEQIMVEFAEKAAELGLDMLVMDDGWFGARDSDWAGLGDWWANPRKFRNGLKKFVENVKKYPVKFGIWIEPEMVNPDSELYRAHPDWALRVAGRESMMGRNQLVLDMSNPQVVEYLKDSFEKTLGDVDIDYIKWDFNRILTQVGSDMLPPERQGEVSHRFMMGTYDLYRWFRERFPNVMIENCSGGGGRYDLGMMKYSHQIWASDNTDPIGRCKIQYGSTVPYPVNTMSCHVNNPRESGIEGIDYRFAVAINGMLGYEMDILYNHIAPEVLARIPEHVKEYRKYESLIKTGDFYRLLNPFTSNYYSYYFADEKSDHILMTFIQMDPDKKEKELTLKVSRADKNAVYVDEKTGDRYTGEELRRGVKITTSLGHHHWRMWYLV